jgi:hypothetical protein
MRLVSSRTSGEGHAVSLEKYGQARRFALGDAWAAPGFGA